MIRLTKEQSSLWINTLQAIKDEESRFGMCRWFTYGTNGEGEACGTAACFAGHAHLIQKSLKEDFLNGHYVRHSPGSSDVIASLGGFFRDNALFYADEWIKEARALYESGHKYDGVMMQVKWLFEKYDVRLHPDFCTVATINAGIS